MNNYIPRDLPARGSTRDRVLTALAEGSADIDQLAGRLEVHRTVVHGHLRRLREAGLVEATSLASVRGRPRHAYRLVVTAIEQSWPPRQHRLLAAVLAGALESHAPDPEAAARRAGVACAKSLGVAGLEDLVRLGWRYRGNAEQLFCDNCAFREACLESAGVPCHVHAGLLEVALGRPMAPARRTEFGCAFAPAPVPGPTWG